MRCREDAEEAHHRLVLCAARKHAGHRVALALKQPGVHQAQQALMMPALRGCPRPQQACNWRVGRAGYVARDHVQPGHGQAQVQQACWAQEQRNDQLEHLRSSLQ